MNINNLHNCEEIPNLSDLNLTDKQREFLQHCKQVKEKKYNFFMVDGFNDFSINNNGINFRFIDGNKQKNFTLSTQLFILLLSKMNFVVDKDFMDREWINFTY